MDNRFRKEFAGDVTGQYDDNLHKQHDYTFAPAEEEEEYHKTEYKVAGHAAVCSAACKKNHGKEKKADYDDRNPDTHFVNAEFVAEPKGGDRNKEHSHNRENRRQRDLLNYPDDDHDNFRDNTEHKYQIENSSFEGKLIRKKILGDKIPDYSAHFFTFVFFI
jgi:hypothetical protein